MNAGTGQVVERGVVVDGQGEGQEDPFEMLTAGEVATWLKVTKDWVYTQTRSNHIPYVPLGRYVRYRRSAVKAWVAEIERSTGGRRW
jgi:excisionase family DNA binding protein